MQIPLLNDTSNAIQLDSAYSQNLIASNQIFLANSRMTNIETQEQKPYEIFANRVQAVINLNLPKQNSICEGESDLFQINLEIDETKNDVL